MANKPLGQPEEVRRLLDRARHDTNMALAAMWGAVKATAPADRWASADRDLAGAIAKITGARAELAAIEKREAYCTTCGMPVLRSMQGWEHWDTARHDFAEAISHEVELDWRPVEVTPDDHA